MTEIKDKFKESFGIFKKECLDKKGESISCKMQDVFGGWDSGSHNCLPCNFSESTQLLYNYLRKHKNLNSIQEDITVYILLLYLFIERVEFVFDIIKLPTTYKEKHFKVFQSIRKWANFIKHPKAFVFTHHPTYDFESSKSNFKISDFNVVVNDVFVSQYYKAEVDFDVRKKLNKELSKKLQNNDNVLVVFPDIVLLTKKFCDAYKKFVDVITKNEVYIDMLKDDATIASFLENE